MDGEQFGIAVIEMAEKSKVPPEIFILVLAGILGGCCCQGKDPDETLETAKIIMEDAFACARNNPPKKAH